MENRSLRLFEDVSIFLYCGEMVNKTDWERLKALRSLPGTGR